MDNWTFYNMGFDAFWEYVRRNRNNLELLSDIYFYVEMLSFRTSPFSLFNSEQIDRFNKTVPYLQQICFADLDYTLKAWCTHIEGDYSINQRYIQAKPSYDDRSANLEAEWDKEWEDMQKHNTVYWYNTLRNILRNQSKQFWEQFAKNGVIFLAASKTAFTSKQYKYLRALYDSGTLL